MKALLAELQQLQMNDNLEHEIKVEVSKSFDGGILLEAWMMSNIEKGENDSNVYFYVSMSERRSKRENEAELEKFKYLLLSDVATKLQQK